MKWLTGKKTYIGAAGVAITAVVGFWLHTIDRTMATALLFAAFSQMGLGLKVDRYIEIAIGVLQQKRDEHDAKEPLTAK